MINNIVILQDQTKYTISRLIYYTGSSTVETYEQESVAIGGLLVCGTGRYKIGNN